MGIIRSISKGIAITGAVVAGGALVVTARSVLATPQPLESTLEGEKHLFRFREGDIFYTAAGPQGAQPILLLHGTHLSASSFEWRRNFSALSQEFRVYAPDLLGFGLSDRPAIDYSANTYVTFISDFVREVIGRPAMVVARGQSAAFSVRAAYLDPPLFGRLVFISPTGIAEGETNGQAEQGGPIEALRGVLRRVSETTAGEVPYALLTTKSALSLFVARQSYAHSEQITPALVQHLFATTHQHGARFAPLAFMTGKLDLPVAGDFARLEQPALIVWGEQDAINDPLHAEALRHLNARARLELISSAGNAVQDEQAQEINELLRAWFLAPAELVDPNHQPRRKATKAGAEQVPAAPAAPPTTPPPAPPPVKEETQPVMETVSPEAVQEADLPLPAAPAVQPATEPGAETTQPAPQAAEAATEAPKPEAPARPSARTTSRRASPKTAASRAPKSQGQPPTPPEPRQPPQNGKTPGSRSPGSKKKRSG